MTGFRLCTTTAALVAVLVSALPASGEEIRVLSSLGIKAVIDDLAPKFEKSSKHKVTTVFDLASALKAKIDLGEPFDVAILTPTLLDELIAKGKVAPASRSVVARVGLGLMTKAGAKKLDVGTVDAFKRTLLEAKSITYAAAGASGVAISFCDPSERKQLQGIERLIKRQIDIVGEGPRPEGRETAAPVRQAGPNRHFQGRQQPANANSNRRPRRRNRRRAA